MSLASGIWIHSAMVRTAQRMTHNIHDMHLYLLKIAHNRVFQLIGCALKKTNQSNSTNFRLKKKQTYICEAKSITKCGNISLVSTWYVPTLWQPGFCHAMSFEITNDAHNATTIAWIHAIPNPRCFFFCWFFFFLKWINAKFLNTANNLKDLIFHNFRFTCCTRYSTASNER